MRVDVSGDGGRSWRQATLEHEAGAPFAWTFWEIVLDLPPGEHELAVRAWDSAGQTQPALPDHTWNFKGYLSARGTVCGSRSPESRSRSGAA